MGKGRLGVLVKVAAAVIAEASELGMDRHRDKEVPEQLVIMPQPVGSGYVLPGSFNIK